MLSNPLLDAAFNSIFRNLRQALAISLIPLGLAFAAFLVLNIRLILVLNDATGTVSLDRGQLVGLVIGVLGFVYAGTYVAVRWHCFSLDVPPTLQRNVSRTFLYFLISLLIAIAIVLLLFVVLVLPSSLFLGSVEISIGDFSEAYFRGWPHVVVNAIGTCVFAFVFLSWASIKLVGFATGGHRGGPDFNTGDLKRQIFQIALIYTAATFVWSIWGVPVMPWYLEIIYLLMVYWIAFMMSISIMTEIYRHVFEASQDQRAPDA